MRSPTLFRIFMYINALCVCVWAGVLINLCTIVSGLFQLHKHQDSAFKYPPALQTCREMRATININVSHHRVRF